jgi:4-alpha-glucanotransferase
VAHLDDWPALAELADRCGVSREYWDWQGNHVPVTIETVQALLGALDIDASTDETVHAALADLDETPWRRTLPAVTVGRAGHPVEVLLHVPHGDPLALQVVTEDGAVVDATQVEHWTPPREVDGRLIGEARFVLAPDLPTGYHRLRAISREKAREGLLILAPDRIDLPEDLAHQVWGVMTQLYSVRSRDSWGVGDLADLATQARWAAGLGADFVLVNPLHAAEPVPPVEDSPYLPTSRRYLNPLYLRVTDVPELAALPKKQRAKVEAYAAGPFDDEDGLLDRQASYAAKLAALDLVHAAPRTPARERSFEAFLADQGPELHQFSIWCALAEHLAGDDWPEELGDSGSPEVAVLARKLAHRVRFFGWLQWLCDEQLAAAQAATVEAGMSI